MVRCSARRGYACKFTQGTNDSRLKVTAVINLNEDNVGNHGLSRPSPTRPTGFAFWLRVGIAHASLMKLLVTSKILLNPPLPSCSDRKPIASSSIGSVVCNECIGTGGGSGVLHSIHLPLLDTDFFTYLAINGQ